MFVAANGSCSCGVFNSLVCWSSMTHIQILTKQSSARDYIKGTHHQPSIKITNILPTVHNVKSLQDDLLFRMNSQLSCARQQD